ncbi:sugar ABC transporter ATP-binding protein [Bacillus horti]|uniref:Simple sugar transport system ATP-binding protein n=2 Tax=Caldalkalibacillus horti TaxID=77523 RepID=A0ABT9VW90_9BACI|nr:simple sugar transport system ATP-binding protein [Bacillus horti]
MNKIIKNFSGVQVLKQVDLTLVGGEIHALLGANGAGKSTLIKILSGAYSLDDGEIILDGHEVSISSPQEAKELGIHTVYQEVDTALIPTLSVAENIFIDDYANLKSSFFVAWKDLYSRAEELLNRVGASISVKANISELSLSDKQLVLVARALAQEAKFVILDEPTAPLSVTESENLYRIMRQLKDSGVGVVFISHRLAEVFELSDRITVLRDGQNVSSESKSETSMNHVIEAMLGQALVEEFPKSSVSIGKRLFEAQGLADGGRVKKINLHVSEGEIVGIFGLVGAGKTETARLLFAADPAKYGELYLYESGKRRKLQLKQPIDAVQHGIVLVPEERRREGLITQETVRKNISLSTLKKWSKLGFIQQKVEKSTVEQIISSLGIKTNSMNQHVHDLSGGNQQKVVVGKWLLEEANVYIFDEPTKGIDVGAKRDMYQLIGDLANQGKGILYFSCEHNELIGIADRVLIMYEGQIVKELMREELTQEKLMYYASGGQESGNNQAG